MVMGFGDAIRTGFSHYADFRGRASRAAYWWWTLFSSLVSGSVFILSLTVDSENPAKTVITIVYVLISLALYLPNLAVTVRRLHDTDRSGWWILVSLVPVIGWLVLLGFLAWPGTSGANRYGSAPDVPRSIPAALPSSFNLA